MTSLRVLAMTLVVPVMCAAAPAPAARTPMLEALARCRAVTVETERLACFDASVGKLLDAEAKHDVVVVDREQIRKTRRTLFGLTLPSFNIFGDHDDDAKDKFTRLEAVIGSSQRDGNGRLLMTLDDGAHWRQVDDLSLPRTPRQGDKVVIERAAMGTYMMHIRGVQMRVRREN